MKHHVKYFIAGSGGLPIEGPNLGNGAPAVGDLRMTSIRPMTQPPTTKTLPALAEVNHFLHNTPATHSQMKPLQQPLSKQISPKKASFQTRLVILTYSHSTMKLGKQVYFGTFFDIKILFP